MATDLQYPDDGTHLACPDCGRRLTDVRGGLVKCRSELCGWWLVHRDCDVDDLYKDAHRVIWSEPYHGHRVLRGRPDAQGRV